MSRLLSMPITYVVGVILLLAVTLFAYSMIELRRARTGSYWRIRKEAGQRGGQFFLISVTLFGIAALVAFFTGFAAIALGEFNDLLYGTPNPHPGIALPTASYTPNFPTPDVEGTLNAIFTATAHAIPTQTPTSISSPTEPVTATNSLTPTSVMSATSTATTNPTQTTTPTPTPSPTPTFEAVLSLTPPASTIQPNRDAQLSIIAAAPEISADQSPVQEGDSFPVGITRLYFFIAYQNLDNGVTWSRILFRDDVPVQGGAYMWTLGRDGESFFFFGREDGYPAGDYEMRLYLGENEVNRFKFTITP